MKIAGYVIVGLGILSLLGRIGALIGADSHETSKAFGGIGFSILMIAVGVSLIVKARDAAPK